MKRRNRANRKPEDYPYTNIPQGRKYKRRKCHCKESCGGHKRNKAAEKIDWKKEVEV
jgi:hypothetical protein